MSAIPVKIGAVLHTTYIDVNRRGTEAAAASAAWMSLAEGIEEDPVKYVSLDRPFIFGIMDTNSCLPIFAGVVNHLEEKKK